MEIRVEVLRQPEDVRQALVHDGWQVETEEAHCMRARHDHAEDEASARVRLHHLGLLTSGSLRIQFERLRRAGPPGQRSSVEEV